MPDPGDTKERFGRQYIYLNPATETGGAIGTWRLRIDDTGTPPIDGGGGGGSSDLSVAGIAGETIIAGELLYMAVNGTLRLASASSVSTSQVVGMARTGGSQGEAIRYVRNEVEDFFNSGTVVDGSPASLIPGQIYFLSTNPGNWTTTPDTTTTGAVVRSCGIATSATKMSVEIQIATVI
jgi:hypothetical protein